MYNNNKIQALMIGHLQKHGALKLLLPDGIVLEIGINQLGMDGELINTENYCWIIASKEDKIAVLDSYNLGLRFNTNSKSVVYEDTTIDSEGKEVKRLDVV